MGLESFCSVNCCTAASPPGNLTAQQWGDISPGTQGQDVLLQLRVNFLSRNCYPRDLSSKLKVGVLDVGKISISEASFFLSVEFSVTFRVSKVEEKDLDFYFFPVINIIMN